jgi:hypothetical protein
MGSLEGKEARKTGPDFELVRKGGFGAAISLAAGRLYDERRHRLHTKALCDVTTGSSPVFVQVDAVLPVVRNQPK